MKNKYPQLKLYLGSIFFIFIICLIFAEALSFFALSRREKTRILPEYINFYQKYNNQVNHLRDPELAIKFPEIISSPESLMFSKFGSGLEVILLQGDSWAEHILFSPEDQKIITKFIGNKFTFIDAGTSSYSASPMTAQLDILKKDFDISPTIVIGIFDQTDIGDELCRYRDLRSFNSGRRIVEAFPLGSHELYAIEHFIQSETILRSSTFNLIKLAQLSWYGYKLKKYRMENTTRCGWGAISSFLEKGVSEEDQAYLISVINYYIKAVFENSKTKQLILVTHPHRLHLEGKYRLNINTLIKKAVNNSMYKSKIILLDFNQKLKTPKTENELDYRFVKGDLASHLNADYYANSYLIEILKRIKLFEK
jgi:hypothetical protein